jgi:hypothetical protein
MTYHLTTPSFLTAFLIYCTGNSTPPMWYSKIYDPVKAGSIDGTDTEPHDAAIVRALNAECR